MDFEPLIISGDNKMIAPHAKGGNDILLRTRNGVSQVSVENLKKFLQYSENLGIEQPRHDTVALSQKPVEKKKIPFAEFAPKYIQKVNKKLSVLWEKFEQNTGVSFLHENSREIASRTKEGKKLYNAVYRCMNSSLNWQMLLYTHENGFLTAKEIKPFIKEFRSGKVQDAESFRERVVSAVRKKQHQN